MYEFNVTLNLPFDQAEGTVRQALMNEKLGIVSEINVQTVMKTKLDKDIPAYKILGACNPGLASRVLDAEPNAGTLLPCNLILRAENDDSTVVSFMNPQAVLGLSGSDEVKAVADEAYAGLQRVMEQLQAV